MIRVTVTVNAYFDDDINGPDLRTERLQQLTGPIGEAVKESGDYVRYRLESASDYIQAVAS